MEETMEPVKITKDFADLTGWDVNGEYSRNDVEKFIVDYIKNNDFQNSNEWKEKMKEEKNTITETTTSKIYETYDRKELMKMVNLLMEKAFPLISYEFEDYEIEESEIKDKDSIIEHILYDHKCIAEIVALMIKGELTDAYKIAKKLDTVIREMIPRDVWNFLDKYSC